MRKHSILIGLLTVTIVTGMNWLTIVHAKEELTFTPLVRPFAFALKEPKVDLDKLSKAVACAETSCGKDGTARKRLNLHGVMCWDANGKRYPCTFKSAADSHARFKAIWSNPKSYYKGQMPDLRLATTWVCGPKHPTGKNCGHNEVDNPSNWLATVKTVYNSL